MFYCKIKKRIFFIILILCNLMMLNSEQPVTSWGKYNYSFLQIIQLKNSANTNNYEDAYRLGMYYYLIKKDDIKSIFWLKKASCGNHVEAIRELVKYELLINSTTSHEKIQEYVYNLRKIAVQDGKAEDYYIEDLKINSFKDNK